MEFTHGKTLAEMIGAGPCDFDLALQTAIQATRALLEVHESGLIHGRLTSRSLLLQEGNQLKLLDVVLPYLPRDLVLHDPEEPESQGAGPSGGSAAPAAPQLPGPGAGAERTGRCQNRPVLPGGRAL